MEPLWKVKMKAICIKEKWWDAVEEKYPYAWDKAKKDEVDQIAHSEIMISLADEVARQVINKKRSKELCDSLETLFLVKYLPNRINLLCKLFTYKMNPHAALNENLDKFLTMIQDLNKGGEKIIDLYQDSRCYFTEFPTYSIWHI